ncbi:enoyl-CoA hydratase/isomerase family protein [Gordonia sp. HNM0687]|uniref:Enoyl-CoA hydratase/isomerase family protein n=1 Tax=Gordonia mangrovi TaxID=2665643 RepID=A0A6L7GNK0_9ACTN|nr:enoyl-CoA hydratase-related protein [Gordonia mangrovi]MDY6809123.1 enoyl-CoA hydratase-related protein [Actinomycetota bacterium]MXP20947.1 enoyl-CoA hydratase/isomerase family protein [Gordonia mangrovi]UVF78503.1 enoyl-CoA hydratase-related protein [Gordonia mangrovi]
MTADSVTAPTAEPVTDNDGILTIAISSSAPGNPLNDDALAAGAAALREVARGERRVGVILLKGPGANFCAGGNVRDFASAAHRPTFLREIADNFHAFINALHEAERPVVAAVKGWAAGAGMSIVTHADVAIGGPSTKMRPAYRGIGLSPDGGMTWTLPRLVGAARARQIILTDPVIDAEKALDWGLLSEIVTDDEVDAAALAAAAKIASGPWQSDAAARALLTRSATSTLGDQLAAEARSISALSASPEGIEGVDAFVAKRKPDFGSARNA